MPRPLSEQRQRSAFANWLNDILLTQHISPTALAARAGMSEAYVSLLRNGRRQPSYKAVVRLTRALGLENDLTQIVDLAGLPTLAAVHRADVPRGRKRPPPFTVLARLSEEQRVDAGAPNAAAWAMLVGIVKMVTSDRDWRVRRQAGAMLAPVARAIGGQAIELAKTTLADAHRREKQRDTRETFAGALSMLDHAPAQGARAEPAQSQFDNLRDFVKLSAAG